MPRDIPVGNGSLLVAFDRDYNLREFYFPFVGQENHAQGHPFRLGFWIEGSFSWVNERWQVTKTYLEDTIVTEVTLFNDALKIRAIVNDLVDFHENIYLKKLTVENLSEEPREMRIFFHHDFHIYGNSIGDTAAYRPDVNGLLHYKGERYFLINASIDDEVGVHQFSTGRKETVSEEGTWRDAEDGVLSNNTIAQGSVDSVAAVHLSLEAKSRRPFFYWICAGKNWKEVQRLNKITIQKRPELVLQRTRDYWKLWANKEKLNFGLLPSRVSWLYKRSLLTIRTQIDNRGGILAGNDSDVMQFNRDTYSYMWPRDGALVAYSLDLAGYLGLAQNFFNFCARVIGREGYLLHKYTPTGAVGSSWHPWRAKVLPIQEDETALVIWALWNHFKIYKDIEFVKPLYRPLIKNAADFMVRYRDQDTGMPLPSYDLWEERLGVSTFTASAVCAGLNAAANFCEAFGETEISKRYRNTAQEIREGMDKYLYLEKEKRFARMMLFREDGGTEVDPTVDASVYGVFEFGAYDANDEKVVNTMEQVYHRLWCKTDVGGVARYEGDYYYRVSKDLPGNPWFVCTLWLAQYHIARARTKEALDEAMKLIEWTVVRALPSGVMAEQINPYTGEPISVSPLTWSHAIFVTVVNEYINKLVAIEKDPSCGHPKYSRYALENESR